MSSRGQGRLPPWWTSRGYRYTRTRAGIRRLTTLAPEPHPTRPIAALASSCFRQLIAAPHVVVRVAEQIYDGARSRLDEIARLAGFEGRLVVLAEPGMALGDCRIEWADGGLARDRAATEAAISEAVGRYVAARTGTAG